MTASLSEPVPESPCSAPMSPPEGSLAAQCAKAAAAGVPPPVDADTDDASLSEVSADEAAGPPPPTISLQNVHVRIQKRPAHPAAVPEDDPQHETVVLSSISLPDPPTLDGVRAALLTSDLGRPERDIFFPAWTKSLYICWRLPAPEPIAEKTPSSPNPSPGDSAEDVEDAAGPTEAAPEERYSETETVESDEELRTVVAREAEAPGTLVVQLQECRNARYSRRREKRAAKMPARFAPFWPTPQLAFQVFAEPGTGKRCGDGTVYFDGPLAFAYPFPPPPPPHHPHGFGPAAAGFPDFAYLPPYAMVPFMYAPPNGVGL